MNQQEHIFNRIVQDNHASIYRICRAYLYDRSHAEDLCQEILVRVWQNLDSYKGDAQLSTWIYRIAVNTAISYNRKNSKTQHHELPETVNLADDSHSLTAEKEQQLNALTRAISELEEHDRLVISLVLEDLSYKEIAEITGQSVTNIGVRINRIKARLLKLMTDQNNNR